MRTASGNVLERARRVEDVSEAQSRQRLKEVLKRAELLPEQDRLLIEMVLRQVPRRRIAELLQCEAGTLCRRINRICARLYDPVVLALMHQQCPLAPEIRQVGVEKFLLGATLKDLARKHQVDTSEIKKRLD